MTFRPAYVVTMAMSFLAGSAAIAESPKSSGWTSFRNGGTSQSAGDYRIQWNPTDGIVWQHELEGYGQSTPVIYGTKVFLASVIGPMKDQCCVSCRDLRTGESLWRFKLPAATKTSSNYMHARAAPTPVVDENGVFVFFEGGDLVALSHEGKKLWQRNLSQDFGPFKNNHGLGSSPTQSDTAVILALEHQGPSWLVAIDKATGKDKWKVERTAGNSWASPVVTHRDNTSLVLISSAGSVSAYGADTGKAVWSKSDLQGNSVPSPTVSGDYLLLGARLPEFGDTSAAAKSNLCLKLDGTSFNVAWQSDKVLSDYASPVVAEDCAYYLNKSGVLTCVDLLTGKRHYTKRLNCTCWATPFVSNGRVYFFGKSGETHVIKAGPNFERLAVNRLWPKDKPAKPETYVESFDSAGSHGHGSSGESDKGASGSRKRGLMGMLLKNDKDGDGVLTKEELPPQFKRFATAGDKNGDGRLDQSEMKAMDESFKKRRAGSREGARDPIVYGIAAANGTLLIRTGTRLYAIADSQESTTTARTETP
ncbi:MAG: PQQ-binding-like beta-propeller repeat protein [Planctomycetaceae bacterium]